MNVFTDEFVNAVKGQLDKVEAGYSITREQLCEKIGVPGIYSAAISVLFQTETFADFEIVRAKGIRRKKTVG